MSDNEMDAMTDAPRADPPAGDGDDLATLLARRQHARPNRLTWSLLVLLVLSAGFIGGAFAQKQLGPSGSSGVPDFAALMAGGGPPAGTGFPGSGSGDGTLTEGDPTSGGDTTTGTVTLVDGMNLYLTDSSGRTVKVVVPPTASVTGQEEVALSELAAGTSVLVQGEAGSDGTVTATSVAQADPVATPAGTPAVTSTSPASSNGSTDQGDN
jgi:hypothetical protein